MTRGSCALLALVILAALGSGPLSAQSAAGGPEYRLSADAAAGFTLATDGLDPASANSAAVWNLSGNFLHRLEGPGWGFVLSHALDLSGLTPSASGPGGLSASGLLSAAVLTIHEAYARLDLGDWGQLFVGKRRMGLGIGTTFAPGDRIDPRDGFWDQKDGFRGLDLALSLGPDLSLRAALSLDRNFDAWALGQRAKSAALALAAAPTDSAAAASKAAADAAYAAALDGTAGPADPSLLAAALSTDLLLGSLQLSLAGVITGGSSGEVILPSLGLSLDLGGLILQAEGAVDFSGAPDFHATTGGRYTWAWGRASLTAALDYDWNSSPWRSANAILLAHDNYLLPSLSFSLEEGFLLYVRSLVGLDDPASALLSAGLTLYPAPGFDLEFSLLAAIAESGGEFAGLSAFPPPSGGQTSLAVGIAGRAHF
jgi:hypothetical protein